MRLNNKGQMLILFILLIPVIFMLAAFVIDLSAVIKENTRIYNVSKTVIYEVLKKDKAITDIDTLFIKNNIEISNLKREYKEEILYLENEYNIDSILGGIVGLKSYNINIKLKAYISGDNVVIIKE